MVEQRKKEKILTIDDDAEMLFLEKILLEREGFEVFTSKSAELALDMIPQIPDLNLILCDVEMDKMNGIEFIIRLESRYQGILSRTPVVLVTSHDVPPVTHATGYIRKGTRLADFVEKVRGFMAEPASLI